MALSRIGVWSFDLVITQIMQEYIEPTNDSDSEDDSTRLTTANGTTTSRDTSSGSGSGTSNAGLINGWHYSMMNLFELGQFILTMIWSDPLVYYIPCTLSFACVVMGAIVYSVHVARMRGHLFHYQRIASAASSYLATSTSASSPLARSAAAEGDGGDV